MGRPSVPEPEPEEEKMRWSARTCAPRLLHVLVEKRAAFLQRNAPLARRTVLYCPLACFSWSHWLNFFSACKLMFSFSHLLN